MSDPQSLDTVSLLKIQLAESQKKIDILTDERLLYNLVDDYAHYHDRCFGKSGTVEDDARWESLFTPDGTSNLHPLGAHHGREGKMSWALGFLGGRGQGCQVALSNVRVIIDSGDSAKARARSYGAVTVIPNDVGHTITVKGQYEWQFLKADGAWKIASVVLTPFPKP